MPVTRRVKSKGGKSKSSDSAPAAVTREEFNRLEEAVVETREMVAGFCQHFGVEFDDDSEEETDND